MGPETVANLNDFPKFKIYLDHNTKQHYFFYKKKYGKADCLMCCIPRLLSKVFESLNHLHDPTLKLSNEGHYKSLIHISLQYI